MSSRRRVLAFFQKFNAAQAGAAAVEFALILPVMLVLYIGANEASELISMDRKVQFVSGAVGDLVAQSRNQITPADLANYVRISGGLMTPYSTQELDQVVTQLFIRPDKKVEVVWSRGFRNQVANSTLNRPDKSIYELPAEVLALARDGYIIMAETRRPTKPLFGLVIQESITLYRVNYYLPRFGGKIDLK